jgi:hypothetical protein
MVRKSVFKVYNGDCLGAFYRLYITVVGTIAAIIFVLACFGKCLKSKEMHKQEGTFYKRPEVPKRKKGIGAHRSTS